MKLNELTTPDVLARPLDIYKILTEGTYEGVVTSSEMIEKQNPKSPDGYSVAWRLIVTVQDEEDDDVNLYLHSNYTWSERGNMVKLLEKLDMLPKKGESIDLDAFVGLKVRVVVENVTKDDKTYNNIISIKRIDTKQPNITPKPAPKAVPKADSKIVKRSNPAPLNPKKPTSRFNSSYLTEEDDDADDTTGLFDPDDEDDDEEHFD